MAKPTRDTLKDTIKTLLESEHSINLANVTPETTCKDIGLDSLDLVELVISLEDTLSVNIMDEKLEVEASTTLDQFTDMVLNVIEPA